MDRLWSFGPKRPEGSRSIALPRRRTAFSLAVLRSRSEHCSAGFFGRRDGMYKVMYSGTLIADLFAAVERVQNSAAWPQIEPAVAEPPANVCHCAREISESEQFPQPFGLSPAHGYLGLLLVVHSQLVRALEPGHDFANPVDVHQIGAVRS